MCKIEIRKKIKGVKPFKPGPHGDEKNLKLKEVARRHQDLKK